MRNASRFQKDKIQGKSGVHLASESAEYHYSNHMLPNISGKNALAMEKDKAGIKHITEFLETEGGMKEEVTFIDCRVRLKYRPTLTTCTI